MLPVVVTGFGVVGPHGNGRAGVAEALACGASSLRPVEQCALHDENSARLALFQEGDLSAWLNARVARRFSPSSRFAVAAAQQAFADAGIDAGGGDAARTSVRLGVSFGPSSITERLLEQILNGNPQDASPMLFMESVANAPAGQVAMALDLRGPNAAIAQREAAAVLAFIGGVSDIASGRCDRALVGAVDEMTSITHGILDRFGALAKATGSVAEGARPFSVDRNGMVISEGCTVAVLEEEGAARRRGAPILARVVATARGSDPTAPAASWGRGGRRLAQTLARRLAAADIDRHELDCVVSGAAGSVRGDRAEADVLRALWADHEWPPVIAPKSVTGEYGGGFLAAALLATGGAAVAAPQHFQIDPALGVQPAALPASGARRALISALAAGGAAGWLVLEGTE